MLRALQRGNRIDLPTLQHLSIAAAAWNGIGERQRQPVTNIKVAVRVFRANIIRILWQACAVAEIPVRAHVIGSMSVGVSRDHAQTMEIAGVQSGLQTVVVGAVDVPHLENIG